MPPPPPAPVAYKKKDGSLSISEDAKYLFWTPSAPPNSSPAVTVPVADITNLQQTPESSPKVALKVFIKDDNHVFSFTGGSARKNQEAFTDTLRNTLAAAKATTASSVLPSPSGAGTPRQQSGGDAGQPAAMAIAKAVSSKAAAADDGWYDDNKLKNDIQLQRSLLESDQTLATRFNQALKDRPDNVSASQFTAQFWSARVHLLRAHAIEKAQKQGEYNVLPEIKFVRKAAEKDGDADIKQLNITKEQIKLIFKQYPVVSEAYDENVGDAKRGKLTPGEFWQRFFGSRLLKKLKGEKITQVDPPDGVLDKYLDRREAGPASMSHVPHFMDLEGNEQNHSQRKGNRPDEDMRPSGNEKVPILRVLNNLSEKMLSHVAPEDTGEDGQHAPIGLDEETFEQLRLRDLAREDADTRVKLNVREQQRYLGGNEQDDDLSAEAKLYLQQDPAKVLSTLKSDLRPSHLGSDDNGTIRLDKAIGYISDSDSEDEDGDQQMTNGSTPSKRTTNPKIGSHASHTTATASLLTSIKARRLASATPASDLRGLSQETFDQLTITHNTTTEFLHYFWTLFLSGSPSQAHINDLANLITTLDRSLDRIHAVGAQAEDERSKKVEALKEQVREYERRKGKRRKVDFESVDGGGKVVEGMVGPTVRALEEAVGRYRKAYEEQSREATAAGAG